MLQRRIELCSGRTSSADAALQTAGAAANGQPTGPRAGSRRCKSKAKNPRGFGGQSHPIPSITHERNRELRVRFFGGSTVGFAVPNIAQDKNTVDPVNAGVKIR